MVFWDHKGTASRTSASAAVVFWLGLILQLAVWIISMINSLMIDLWGFYGVAISLIWLLCVCAIVEENHKVWNVLLFVIQLVLTIMACNITYRYIQVLLDSMWTIVFMFLSIITAWLNVGLLKHCFDFMQGADTGFASLG